MNEIITADNLTCLSETIKVQITGEHPLSVHFQPRLIIDLDQQHNVGINF